MAKLPKFRGRHFQWHLLFLPPRNFSQLFLLGWSIGGAGSIPMITDSSRTNKSTSVCHPLYCLLDINYHNGTNWNQTPINHYCSILCCHHFKIIYPIFPGESQHLILIAALFQDDCHSNPIPLISNPTSTMVSGECVIGGRDKHDDHLQYSLKHSYGKWPISRW